MTVFFYYLLKVVLCSGVLFLYYSIALRNKLFHQWNRFYLLSAVVLSLLLPLLQFTFLFSSPEPNGAIRLVRTVQSADEMLENLVVLGRQSPSPEQWLQMGYASVCFLFFLAFLVSIWRIVSLIRSSAVQYLGSIRFINTRAEGAPFSFFRYIFWHERIALQSETGQQIFHHEMVHVEEKHTLDKVFLQLVLVVFWCNPFFWLIRKEIRFIHEFIADQKAVGQKGTAAFAAMVLQASLPQHYNGLTNSFFQTPIKRRLAMLTKLQNPRLNYLSRIVVLPLVAITVFAFTVRVQPAMVAKLKQTFVVVIDAGHGKAANGQFSGARKGEYAEDQLALHVALKIKELNSNPDIRIVLSRPGEELVGLHERVAVAQEAKADLFISVHLNAVAEEPASGNAERTGGIEIAVASKPTPFDRQSERIGSALQRQLASVYNTYPMLLKANAWVLNQNVCPAVLIQCGYITNDKDRQFFLQEENQKTVAEKILSAINQYAATAAQGKETGFKTDTVPAKRELTGVDVNKNNKTITLHYGNGESETLTEEEAVRRKLITKAAGKNPQPVVTTKQAAHKPLYIVDGKEAKEDEVNKIDPKKIESINVLKDKTAIEKYGERGKYGVIEVNLKKDNSHSEVTMFDNANEQKVSTSMAGAYPTEENREKPRLVFQQTETPASVDKEAWRRFLEKNSLPIIVDAAAKGAKPGTYTVNMRFLVKKDGHLTDIQALNRVGYDIEKKLLSIMPGSPLWNPAKQNGKVVNSYHVQPVTFVIQEQ